MVDTAGTETALDDLEPAAPATDDVGEGNANVLVDDLVVSLGRIVVAKLGRVDQQRHIEVRDREDVRPAWRERAGLQECRWGR